MYKEQERPGIIEEKMVLLQGPISMGITNFTQ